MDAQCNIPVVDRYRLGPLRDVRALDVRAKRQDLAAAVDEARATAEDVAAATARVEHARALLARARDAREALLATGCTSIALVVADRYTLRRRRELDAVVAEAARLTAIHAGRLGAITGVRDRLTAARADKELIERHFARWREARHKLVARRED